MSALSLARAFIAPYEGNALEAYPDGGGVWTIGKGHTGPEVHQGLVWTQAQVDAAYAQDLAVAAAKAARLKKRLLSDMQTAALISLAFNGKEKDLAESQLLAAVNAGQWIEAAHQWTRWDHIGKTEIKGLLIRRLEEAAMFLKGSPA